MHDGRAMGKGAKELPANELTSDCVLVVGFMQCIDIRVRLRLFINTSCARESQQRYNRQHHHNNFTYHNWRIEARPLTAGLLPKCG